MIKRKDLNTGQITQRKGEKMRNPKILILDIESSPVVAHVWGLWDNNVALNQIQSDWHILSWAAKWLGDPPNTVMYRDQRGKTDITDDGDLLSDIWLLLDEADVVIGQNSASFDIRKLNARFLINGYQPPSEYQQLDTKKMASKYFGFTSNKLEYLTDKLCTKYKKLKHKKFEGHSLWTECLKDNLQAWKEMEKYNKHDVLATEELFMVLRPWASNITLHTYDPDAEHVCDCGSEDFYKNGFYYTTVGKYQKYRCKDCGAEYRDNINQIDAKSRAKIRRRVNR